VVAERRSYPLSGDRECSLGVTPPSQTHTMDASELRARARQEADELGPEPPGTEADLWREERWGSCRAARRTGRR
jgi:hypothetical protein